MKLLIAMPSLDYMHSETVISLTRLIMRLKDEGVDFDVEIKTGTLVYVARDRIAYKAIDEGFTHVLWLDADMVFNDDLLDDLMFCEKDFVSGIAHGRRPPHYSCVFYSLEPPLRFEEYPNNTFEIAGSGFGCVLMSVECLKAVRDRFGTCFCPERILGEDLAFCQRLHECGFKMYAEPTVRLGHIGHITIYPEDMERWARTIEGIENVRKS